jgi:hypothetical protein
LPPALNSFKIPPVFETISLVDKVFADGLLQALGVLTNGEKSLPKFSRSALMSWRADCFIFIIALVAWYSMELWAAAVSTQQFGRHEIVLQEGTPVAMGEILGIVRRQSGLPEYPLMLGAQKRLLELNILGPGNRPIRLAATEFLWPAVARAGATRFLVERSVREGDRLTLRLRHASLPVQVSLMVNLRQLERMLEGER